MKLETLLQVMFANNQEALIALAVRIDNAIPQIHPEEVIVRLYKDDLAPGTRFKANRNESENPSYGDVKCPVIVVNEYKVDKQYTVQLPNGKLKTDQSKDTNKSIVSETEPIPTPVSAD